VSQDPVEVIREQYAATNDRDFERAMDVYADDVVLVVGEGWGITSGRFEGKAAVGEWFGDWFRQFAPGYHFEIVELREFRGGVVFLDAKHGGSGRASGVTIGSESGYLYRVVNGKIVQVQLFSTPAEALEAASLPEWSGSENG
jgi:ketosteroid isomerase-like protein